jgi:hypothetical protein
MLVTPLEKPVKPPIKLEANEETLLTTEAAKAEPGMVGRETLPGILGLEVEDEGAIVCLAVVVTGRGTVGS